MEMPKPTEAHRALEKLAGSWGGEERTFPSPWDPQGGTAAGRVSNRIALDGFAVIQEYEQVRDGKVGFRGHGVFRWDDAGQCYALHWFDSMGMPPNEFTGSFKDDVFTLTNQGPRGHSRTVFDFREADRYTFRMEVSPDGARWTPLMEGKYARQS